MKQTLKGRFIDDVYNGNVGEYRKARNDDYCKIQFEWSCYIDSLCKSEIITQKKYENAIF